MRTQEQTRREYSSAMEEDYDIQAKKQAAVDVLSHHSKFVMACIGNNVRPSEMRLHLMKEISGFQTPLKRVPSQLEVDPMGGSSIKLPYN